MQMYNKNLVYCTHARNFLSKHIEEISVDGLQWELTPRLLWIGRKNKVAAGGYDITSRTAAANNPKNYKKTLLFTHYEELYSYHYCCKVTAT